MGLEIRARWRALFTHRIAFHPVSDQRLLCGSSKKLIGLSQTRPTIDAGRKVSAKLNGESRFLA